MEENILTVMVGLPRSGKSTWAKTTGCPIVNPDSIRLAIHGQSFVPLAEPYVWAIAETMVRALFISGHTRVILDATNTTQKRRRQWLKREWETHFQVMDTEKEICIERAKLTNREDLIPVIGRMDAQFESLTEAEILDGEHATERQVYGF